MLKYKLNNNVLTCVMGTHPSALPDETLQMENSLDIIIRGEADQTVVDIANIFDGFVVNGSNNVVKKEFGSPIPEKDK